MQQPDFSLELPNDVRAIEDAVEYLVDRSLAAGFGDGDRLRLNLRVSVTEALANAMEKGNRQDPGKRVRLEARLRPDRIVVRVTDEGGGFDPATVPDPTLPEYSTLSSGRGIFLIRLMGREAQHVRLLDPAGQAVVVVSAEPDDPAIGVMIAADGTIEVSNKSGAVIPQTITVRVKDQRERCARFLVSTF